METYVGIDISKNSFDAHTLPHGSHRRYEAGENQVKACRQWIASLGPALILMEATGGYELPLAQELLAAGLPVKIINPKRVRDFAKAMGQLAKTDKIDARIIALYAQTFNPPPLKEFDKIGQRIKALEARRNQLVAMRVQELNRKEHALDADIEKSIGAVVKTMDREIAKVEKQIRDYIDNTPSLKRKSELLKTVPGVGDIASMQLICELPELGTLDRRKIASLVGLAPINRDSGLFRGRRMTVGGRRTARKTLYMPTLVAIQHNPVIRAYYQRLVANGKPKMVALVASMRKLLVILNSMLAKNQPWNENYA